MKAATRFYGPAALGTGTASLFTIASATLGVVRHIHVQNPDTSPHYLTLSIGGDAAGTRIFDAFAIAAGSTLDYWAYHALAAAELIAAHADSTKLVITIGGDLISLG